MRSIESAAISVLAGRIIGGDELPEAGECIEFDARLGDEGPGSWTRCRGVRVTAEMRSAARRCAQRELFLGGLGEVQP